MKIAFVAGTRPESIKLSSLFNLCNKEKIIIKNIKKMLSKKIFWNNPFEDGNISDKILRVLKKELKNKKR
jgi:UDP-N-acetylglucosamine 2-epimerase